MSNQENDSPFDIASLDGLDDTAKLAMLAPLVSTENIYDGSATSREYARLAIKNFDEVLQTLADLAATPGCSADDRVMIEQVTVTLHSKRANAERAFGMKSSRIS